MENRVQAYLSRYFDLGINELQYDGIYSLGDNRTVLNLVYSNKLINELIGVFGIDDDKAKKVITNWAIALKPDVDLDLYWSSVESVFEGIMPIIQRVMARTIAMDLVSVKPLDGPTGQLLYMDYGGNVETYSARTQNYEVADNDAGRRWDNIIQQLHENQQRFDGRLDHPDNI